MFGFNLLTIKFKIYVLTINYFYLKEYRKVGDGNEVNTTRAQPNNGWDLGRKLHTPLKC